MTHCILDEGFYYPGTDVGCLLVHGFTGSPSEMKPLGEFLAKQGIGAYGVRLKGHGTHLEDMVDTRWPDWYQSVEEGMDKVQREYDKVFIVGLSMGGLLALRAASEYKVEGVISINAPIFLPNKLLWALPFLKNFKKYHPKKHVTNFSNPFSYDKYPVKGLDSLLKLIKLTKRETLVNLDKPLLVLQSKKDGTVVPKSGQYIINKAMTEKKSITWLEEAGHIATIGMEQDKVFKEIEGFITKFRYK